MKMDRRLSNGLAWAGALLVIGIPAADYITGTFAGNDTPRAVVVDANPAPVQETAAITPAPAVTAPAPATKPPAVANTSAPAGNVLPSGKPLPSYITGGDAPSQTAATPAPQPAVQQAAAPPQTAATRPTITTPPAQAEQVATLPAQTAPTPMPLSMRPASINVPLASTQPLIIDETRAPPLVPMQQPQAIVPVQQPQPNDIITAEDLESWESGPLSEFLARRGQQSSATYQVQQNPNQNQPDYDPNGFWLDEGPANGLPIRRLPPGVDYYPPY